MNIEVEKRLDAFVTHVQYDDRNMLKVWAQLDPVMARNIEESLKNWDDAFRKGMNRVAGIQGLSADTIYVARFKDDTWYRAKIMSVAKASMGIIECFFVDYGNVDEVSINDIRRIDVKTGLMPHQAQEFILANVVPVGSQWSKEAIEFCKDRLENEDVRFHVLGHMQGVPLINIFCDNNHASLSFAQELVCAGLARQPVELSLRPTMLPQQDVVANYPTVPLELGECELLVINVESSVKIWVQSRKMLERYNWPSLMNSLEHHFRTLHPGVDQIAQVMLGQVCIARSDQKGCAARGRIESVEGRLGCKVFFVDYGYVEVKMLDNVFLAPPSYMGVPAMAYPAVLALDTCSDEDEKRILSMKPANDPIPINVNILGMGTDGKYRLQMRQQPTQCWLTPSTSPNHQCFPKQNFTTNSVVKVEISHVVSAAEFYVVLLESKTHYELLSSEMQFMHSQVEAPFPLRLFPPGLPCAVRSMVDKRWYRGEIVFSLPNGTVQVFLIDTGKTEVLPTTSIFEICTTFISKLPAQAIKCQMYGLNQQESQAAQLVRELIKFDKEGLQMKFIDKNPKTDAFIVHLVSYSNVAPLDILTTLSKTMTKLVVPPARIEPVETLFIMVFESVHNFFGQLEKVTMDQLNGLRQSLNQYYSKLTSGEMLLSLDDDYVGAFCCAPYSLDRSFYRGRILSKSANMVEVFFIDYGNKETMSLSHVKRLLPEFAILPQIGITCHLATPMRVAASSEAIGRAILNQSVCLEIFDEENYSYAVKFCAMDDNAMLTKKLVSCGLILPPSPPLLEYRRFELGDTEDVKITFFLTPLHFWVQCLRNMTVLNTIGERIVSHMKLKDSLNNVIRNPKEGMACLAEFPEDNVWYRATVKSTVSKTEVEVYFVDYGNSCKVGLSALRIIPDELMEFPSQAVECCFANVRPVEFSKQVLQRVEMKLLDRSFPVRVLSHEYPIKVEFTLESAMEILLQNGILKGRSNMSGHPSSFPQANGGMHEDDELDNGSWGDTSSPLPEASPVQPLISNTHYGRNDRGAFEMRRGSSEDHDSSAWNSNHNASYPKEGRGSPRENANQNRWETAPREWVGQPRQDRWSGSQGSEDRKHETRGYVHRFVPPRMQRQMELEGTSSFSTKTYVRSDSRSESSYHCDNSTMASPPFAEPQKKTDIPQLPDLAGQFKLVTVVHAASPQEVYCQLAEHKAALNDLLAKLNSRYGELRASECALSEVCVGAVCCAQYFGDSTWYRARVAKVNGYDVIVSFVDYGNEETVKSNKLKMLLPDFVELPAQAVKCCLDGVRPTSGTWETESGKLLMTTIKNKTLLCQFLAGATGGVLPIRLIDLEQMKYAAVNYDLLARGQALPTNPKDVLFLEVVAGYVASLFPEPSVELGVAENVSIVWVNDLSQFFCQLERNAGQMEELEKRLKKAYSSGAEEKFCQAPAVNTPCAALLCGLWYRAIAMMMTDKDAVVYFVDYGNVEVVASKDIKVLKPEFMDLQAQAYKCNLRAIRPFGKYWPKMDATKFQKYFDGSVVCTFCGKFSKGFEVDLTIDGKDVAQQMIADKLARGEAVISCPAVQTIPKSSLDAFVDSPAFVPATVGQTKTLADACQSDLPIWSKFETKFNEHVEVMFSYVNSPDQFYLQYTADEARINTLLDDLSNEYGDSVSEDVSDLAVGSLCVAKYSQDDGWYRAVILSSTFDDFNVKFIDFGNEETIFQDKVRKIAPKFVDLPQLAAECELHDFRVPDGGPSSDDIYSAFNNLIQEGEKRVMAEFLRQVNGKFVVALYDDDKDLTSELLASLDLPRLEVSDSPSAYSIRKFDVGDSVEVYVSHIISPSEFWVQRVCDDGDITKLQEDLNSHCSACVEHLSDPAVGSPCLAQYTADENWYRAIVLATAEEGVNVQFVDYGNCDLVSPDKIQRITELFLEPHQLAIKCALNGLENCPQEVLSSQTVVDAFFGATGDAVSANVLGKAGDVLLVQLLNGDVDVKVSLNLSVGEPDVAEAANDHKVAESQPDIVENESEVVHGKADVADDEPEIAVCVTKIVENVPKIAYKEPEIAFNDKMEVYLSSITSPSFFWIQMDSRSVELTEMATQLDEAYGESPLDQQFKLSKGGVCIAQYSVDESWYRASILDVLSDDAVSVLFVDYGNVEIIPFEKVRRPSQEFLEIPVFAHPCRLTRLNVPEGGSWDEEVNEVFKELLNFGETMCLAEFLRKEGGLYVVRLLNMGVDVTESLVETGKVEASISPLQFGDENPPKTEDNVDSRESGVENISEINEDDIDVTVVSHKEPIIQHRRQSPEDKIVPGHITNADLNLIICSMDEDAGEGSEDESLGKVEEESEIEMASPETERFEQGENRVGTSEPEDTLSVSACDIPLPGGPEEAEFEPDDYAKDVFEADHIIQDEDSWGRDAVPMFESSAVPIEKICSIESDRASNNAEECDNQSSEVPDITLDSYGVEIGKSEVSGEVLMNSNLKVDVESADVAGSPLQTSVDTAWDDLERPTSEESDCRGVEKPEGSLDSRESDVCERETGGEFGLNETAKDAESGDASGSLPDISKSELDGEVLMNSDLAFDADSADVAASTLQMSIDAAWDDMERPTVERRSVEKPEGSLDSGESDVCERETDGEFRLNETAKDAEGGDVSGSLHDSGNEELSDDSEQSPVEESDCRDVEKPGIVTDPNNFPLHGEFVVDGIKVDSQVEAPRDTYPTPDDTSMPYHTNSDGENIAANLQECSSDAVSHPSEVQVAVQSDPTSGVQLGDLTGKCSDPELGRAEEDQIHGSEKEVVAPQIDSEDDAVTTVCLGDPDSQFEVVALDAAVALSANESLLEEVEVVLGGNIVTGLSGVVEKCMDPESGRDAVGRFHGLDGEVDVGQEIDTLKIVCSSDPESQSEGDALDVAEALSENESFPGEVEEIVLPPGAQNALARAHEQGYPESDTCVSKDLIQSECCLPIQESAEVAASENAATVPDSKDGTGLQSSLDGLQSVDGESQDETSRCISDC